MTYGGEQCDVATLLEGKPIPSVHRSLRGELVGDKGVLDGDPVEWEGKEWVWSNWPLKVRWS